MRTQRKKFTGVLFAALFLLTAHFPANARIVFVNAAASGGNNGTSWLDAYTDLQSALVPAVPGDSIWVAAAMYKPTSGSERAVTFQLKNGVSLYGGFAGTETMLDERDWAANATVLSGEIGVPGTSDDNSYHVVKGSDTGPSAVLDGFTLRDGNGYGDVWPSDGGGGLFIKNGSPTVRNILFTANKGRSGGGLSVSAQSTPSFTNVTFTNNEANIGGGGTVSSWSGIMTMTHAVFVGNTASSGPGGLSAQNLDLREATFEGNSAQRGGGLDCDDFFRLTDAVFRNNTATYGGGAVWARGHLEPHYLSNVTFENNSAPKGGAIYAECCEGVFEDMEFVDNSATEGGGLYVEYHRATFRDLSFTGNSATRGGGIYMASNGYAPSFINIRLEDNSATQGGGFYNAAGPKLVSVAFTGNSVTGDGGGMYNLGRSASLVNVLFYDNSAWGNGGGMCNLSSAISLTNATFAQNLASNGGALHNDGGTVTVINSIMWDDSAYVSPEVHNMSGVSPMVSFSDIEGSGGSGAGWNPAVGTDGGRNIDAAPLFGGEAGGDLRLALGSPCVETGNSTVPGLPATDLDGAPRIQGIFVDMGAYESSNFCALGGVLYVNEASLTPGSGASWDQAYPKLTDALRMAGLCPGVAEIWVAEGTYKPTSTSDRTATFALRSGLAVYGGFAGAEVSPTERELVDHPTVLSGDIGAPLFGDNVFHVVTGSGTDSSAVLDGFIVTYGEANGTYPNDRGGGMLNVQGSPTVRNCVFSTNTAKEGGGMSNFVSSSPTLVNVVFHTNTATGSGGAIANSVGHPVITNASLSGNTAAYGGAIFNNAASPLVTNTILWGNTAIFDPEVRNMQGSVPAFSHSIIAGSGGSGAGWKGAFGSDGGNNIDADPLFIDAVSGDLHLDSESPAVDGGTNDAPHISSIDLDGNPRIIGLAADMGAYEYGDATGVANHGDPTARFETALRPVFPNPFNPTATIGFELDRPCRVRLVILDVQGGVVRELLDEMCPAGPRALTWDAKDGRGTRVASGVYFCRLSAGNRTLTKKMVLLK